MIKMRITQNDIQIAVERLNGVSKRRYRANYAYGKCRLVVYEQGSSINNVGPVGTKPDLYYQIHTILDYLRREDKEI